MIDKYIQTFLQEDIGDGDHSTLACVPKTNSGSESKQKSGTSVQCSGLTKAGNRCTRMTSSENGRCYQHGGN